jgi:hypothetical protein
VVGTKRIAPHGLFKDPTVDNHLKVRIPLLAYPRLTTTQNKLFQEDLPSQQHFPESLQNFRIPLDNTAMRADVNTTAMSEMIVYSDLSDEDPVTGSEDTVEAETAIQSPN